MKEIASFYDVGEAQVAAGYLRSLGFNVTLPEQHALGAQPELRFAFGGYRLLVPDDDAVGAEAALNRIKRESHGPACPHCGERELRRERRIGIPLLHLLGGFLLPFARGADTFKCRHCGEVVSEDEIDEPEPEL
ncbi:hypothetical protein HK107_12670 [Parvularcula sp. ZS-1/3]|uniref:DUF2007 domain-containing protein n=1 Tax=Parvularcula mediterranea TaxID=2732508 RepID=A0A7Y3RN70_9PROT|nr:hypothetical protein [Parvularcula mediterranea]NNU17177.1 hypothetical protein [Parvularcula mediterranea]